MDHSFLAAADDIDKVLDDFEQNEEVCPDFRITSHSVKKLPLSTPKIATHNMNGDSSMHIGPGDLVQDNFISSSTPLPNTNGGYREKSDTVTSTDSDFQLDLSEADFAPSPQSLPPNLASLSFLHTNQQEGLGLDSQNVLPALHLENAVQGNSVPEGHKEELRKERSDSNTQLGLQDFSSYLPTNTHRTLSFGDLKSMNTSSLAKETSYEPCTPSENSIAPDSTVTHSIGTTLTQAQSTEEVRQSDALNYVSSNSNESASPRHTLESRSAETTVYTTSPHNSVTLVNSVEEEVITPLPNTPIVPLSSKERQLENSDSVITDTTLSVQEAVRDTDLVNTEAQVSELTDRQQQNTSIDFPKISSDADHSESTHVSQETVDNIQDPQTLDDNSEDNSSTVSTTVSSTLPDPKLMDEYVRQGARPKTILPGGPTSSPKHSPLKGSVSEDSSPKKVTPKIVQPNPSPPSSPKAVVGFQSIDNITVTDADLDALDEEDKTEIPLQGVTPILPNPAETGQLSVTGTMEEGDSPREGPVSKLLNQSVPTSMPQQMDENNEFASMDPYYNANNSTPHETQHLSGDEHGNITHKLPTPVHGIQDGNVGVVARSDEPSLSPQGFPIQSSISSGLHQQPPGPNRDEGSLRPSDNVNNPTVPKQTTNASMSSQLNNSNSQLPGAHPKGQVDSLLDISNTALQGLSLAINATVDTNVPNSVGSPQHQSRQEDNSQHMQPPVGTNQETSTLNQQHVPIITPAENGDMSTSLLANRTQRSNAPNAFQLPPPEDPPTYQQVTDATRMEAQPVRPQGALRQGLTLNFEHPPLRKTTAQPIPPSPIIEDATPETNVSSDGSQSDLTGLVNPSEPVPSQMSDPRLEQPNGQVPQSVLLLPGGPNSPNADVDSRTSSNETDSDHEGDFPPGLVAELSEELIQLGNVAPVWLPDSEAPNCMMCTVRFTFRKRRHHCRACGKIFCSKCCSTRIKLKYMDSKEARVCVSCLNTILRAQALQRQLRPAGTPDPRNPAEYCSTVPPTQQASQTVLNPDTAEPPSVMVPVNKSSLRRPPSEGSQKPRETRHVRFSDGIHPGVDQGDLASPKGTSDKTVNSQSIPTQPEKGEVELQGGPRRKLLNQAGSHSLIPHNENALPPIIVTTQIKGEFMVEENPDVEQLLADLRSEDNANPVVFVLNKNLLVMVKIVNLNCCVNRTCWCFATKGMATAGQDEIVIVLECLPDEKMVPKDIFTHLQTVYEEASKGNTVSHMSHSICSQGFLGSRDHGGFLYLQPTFQCLRQLILPESPYLFAVLLQKWETPWAKVFPLRLLLRLGAEFRYYPCPLMSVRFRKPVFGEIGHTIMNLLADFKNYQYLLPVIPGVTILMKDRETNINFPKNRYDDVMKVLNNSNEHVMALAANFSSEADSHLVCIQNDDGSYQTQAINIQNKPRKVTGASFVVFNGALKSSSGLTAKSSIVEDGLMVQIRPEMMTSLRQAIREMQDFVIPCKSVAVEQVEETVCVKWVEDDQKFNIGVTSPIDGRSMEGIESVRIHNGTDFRGKSRSLRWTEVFFLENNEPVGRHHEPVDLSKLAESLSMAFSVALANHLDELREMGLAKLGLRVTIDTERVGYEAGSKAQQLPPMYMNELDNELIPVLHNAVSQHEGGPVILELIFHIIE